MYNLVGGAHGAVHCATIYRYEYGCCLIHTPNTGDKIYNMCWLWKKMRSQKFALSLHFVVYFTYHCVHREYVNPNDHYHLLMYALWMCVCERECVCVSVYTGFRSQISMEFSLDTRQKICGFRGEQSSKNRKLTHVCWTKWKYFSVVHLMENVCFGFYGWNVFVCSTTVCFRMKREKHTHTHDENENGK